MEKQSGMYSFTGSICIEWHWFISYTKVPWRDLQTPWSRALKKLIVTNLVKKFPVFYGTRRFITMLPRARHRPLPEPDKSSPHFPTLFSLDPFHYYPPIYAWVFHVVSLPFRFPDQNFVCTCHLSHACCMPLQSHLPWLCRWSVQDMKLLIMQSSPISAPCSQTLYVLSVVCEFKSHTHTKQQIKL